MSLYKAVRKRLGRVRRYLRLKLLCARAEKEDVLRFTCNICGKRNACPLQEMEREIPSCYYCASTVRLRSIINALSVELFGESLPLPKFPKRLDITGIGLSDEDTYASRLAEKLSYTNTFYHREPFLDITTDGAASLGQFDFLINTEVFEHIAQPVEKSFENARKLLRPGGVMIFSVPYREGETEEHFPQLHKYSIEKHGPTWVLLNETADGRKQRYENPVFHGGPGTVVQMRVYGKDSLRGNLLAAGFDEPKIYAEENREFGIVWVMYHPEKLPYNPPIPCLDTPPWAVRVPRS